MPKYVLINLKDMLKGNAYEFAGGINDLVIGGSNPKTQIVYKNAVSTANQINTLSHDRCFVLYSFDPTKEELALLEQFNAAYEAKKIKAPDFSKMIFNKQIEAKPSVPVDVIATDNKDEFFTNVKSHLQVDSPKNVKVFSTEDAVLESAKKAGFKARKVEGKEFHTSLGEHLKKMFNTVKTFLSGGNKPLVKPLSFFEQAIQDINDRIANLESEQSGCFAFFKNTQAKRIKINFLQGILDKKPASLSALQTEIKKAETDQPRVYKIAIEGRWFTRTRDLLANIANLQDEPKEGLTLH